MRRRFRSATFTPSPSDLRPPSPPFTTRGFLIPKPTLPEKRKRMSRSPRRSPNVRVNVSKQARHPQLPSPRLLTRIVNAVMAAQRPTYRGELNVVFVDRKTIRRLHKDYLNSDESTDVMAFPYSGDAESELP